MGVSVPSDLRDVDIVSPDVYVQGYPHEAWTRLRREAPVCWFEPREGYAGFWAITRHEDIVAISRNPERFSSARIDLAVRPAEAGSGHTLLNLDPPRHGRLRQLIARGFTPRQIARLEPHIREIVTGILDDALPTGGGDFVVDIAAKLPLAVICEMMGAPREDWQRIFDMTNAAIGADDPEFQRAGEGRDDTRRRAQLEFMQFSSRFILERREQPGNDLISILVHADVDGEKLTDAELLAFCMLLFAAGNETTRNAASGGALAFQEHRDEWERLRKNPDLMPAAVEEVLRWTTPVTHFCRVAKVDVELRGQQIRAGDTLAMWYGSANRDEDLFAEPFRFDIGRSPNEHLAFGIGEHFCLGASLARLELRVMFEELVRRLDSWESAGPVERLRFNQIGGIKHMPMRWRER